MTRKTIRPLLLLVAALLGAGCQLPIQPSTSAVNDGSARGSLTIHANLGQAQRVLMPPGVTIVSYSLTVTDVSGTPTVYTTQTGNATGTFQVFGLNPADQYLLHLDAFESLGKRVASTDDSLAANTVQVLDPVANPNLTNSYTLQLGWLANATDPVGSFSFSLSLSPPPGTVVSGYAAVLQGPSGTYGWSQGAFSGTTIAVGDPAVAPGAYTLTFDLKDAANIVIARPRYSLLILGNQTTSVSVTLPRSAFGVPDPVTNLTYQFTNALNPRAVLNWFIPEVNTADSFVILRSTDGFATYSRIGTAAATAVTFTDSAPPSTDTHYQYKVAAYSALYTPTDGADTPAVADFTTGSLWDATTNLPSVTISGPSLVTAASPLATFVGSTTLANVISSQWLVDGDVVQNLNAPTIANLVLDTAAMAAGVHSVLLKVTDHAKTTVSSAAFSFQVRAVPTGKVVAAVANGTTFWLKPDATLWGWGRNDAGQLGIGSLTDQATPTLVMSEVADVATQGGVTIILKKDGSVWTTGVNSQGQLGDGLGGDGTSNYNRSTPFQILAGGGQAVAATYNVIYVLKLDGTLWAAGHGPSGGLGNGTTAPQPTLVQVATQVSQIKAGFWDAMYLSTSGALFATGTNDQGQLGLGDTTQRLTWTEVVPLRGLVRSFFFGYASAFVIKTDDTLWATGSNQGGGQFGSAASSTTFFNVGLSGVDSVAVLYGSTAVLTKSGQVWVTGSNNYGQLAEGSFTSTTGFVHPLAHDGLVQALYAGQNKLYLLRKDGTLYAAGSNQSIGNPLGDGTTIDRSWPVEITTQPARNRVFKGFYETFFLRDDGFVYASGLGSYGQAGTGITGTNYNSPASTNQFATLLALAGSGNDYRYSVVLRKNGSIGSLGQNTSGSFGTGSADGTSHATLTLPTGFTNSGVVAVSAQDGTLVLKNDGTVWAVGYNKSGSLGIGNVNVNGVQPSLIQVPGVDHVVQIGTGLGYSMLLKADGTVWAAGDNTHGQLGRLSGFTNSSTFVQCTTQVPAVITGVKAISVGQDHAMLLKFDGTVWETGQNGVATELASGRTGDQFGFFQVADHAIAVESGGGSSYYLRDDHTLWAGGYGDTGALGDGMAASRNFFAQIADDVIEVRSRGDNTTIVKSDGSVWSSGANANGNAGVGTNTDVMTFTRVSL